MKTALVLLACAIQGAEARRSLASEQRKLQTERKLADKPQSDKPQSDCQFPKCFAGMDVEKAVVDLFENKFDFNGDKKVTAEEMTMYAKTIGFCQDNTAVTDPAEAACCKKAFGLPDLKPESTVPLFQGIVAMFDRNNDKSISITEMKALVNNPSSIKAPKMADNTCTGKQIGDYLMDDIIDSMMPDVAGISKGMDAATNPSPAMLEARETFNQKMEMAANGCSSVTLENLAVLFEQVYGLPKGSVSAWANKKSSDSSGRRLAQQKFEITLQAFLASQEDADAMAAKSDAGDAFKKGATAEVASVGGTVDQDSFTSEAVAIPGQAPMPVGTFAQLVILFALTGLSCGLAGFVSGMKSKKAGVEKGGCCDTGCCSYFAIKGWAGADLLSALVMLIACFMLFTACGSLVAAIVKILDAVLAVLKLPIPQIQAAAGSFSSYADQLESGMGMLNLLPIAVIVPGLLATFMILLSSLCGFATSGKSYCCAKFPICFSYLILLLCLIFYFILTGVSVALFLPIAQEQLRQATSVCDSMIPMLSNLLVQVEDALGTAKKAGLDLSKDPDLSSMADMVDNLPAAIGLIITLCEAFSKDLISAIEGLLGPCVIGIVATLWAWFNSFGLCCSEGCCGTPSQDGKKSKGVAPAK
jgi:hypothetical protein